MIYTPKARTTSRRSRSGSLACISRSGNSVYSILQEVRFCKIVQLKYKLDTIGGVFQDDCKRLKVTASLDKFEAQMFFGRTPRDSTWKRRLAFCFTLKFDPPCVFIVVYS